MQFNVILEQMIPQLFKLPVDVATKHQVSNGLFLQDTWEKSFFSLVSISQGKCTQAN